jgi:hypothetical protein
LLALGFRFEDHGAKRAAVSTIITVRGRNVFQIWEIGRTFEGEIWGRGATSASCAHGRPTAALMRQIGETCRLGSDYGPPPPAVSAS